MDIRAIPPFVHRVRSAPPIERDTRPVVRVITINRRPDEVYRFWRNFEQLPLFMRHVESVRVLDSRRSYWRVEGPGRSVAWTAEIVEDVAHERIAWRSVDGSDVSNHGIVTFQPAPAGGTEVRVEAWYAPPAGRLGVAIAKLLGREPGQEIAGDLRRLKQVMETGEVVHSDASIHRGARAPARPMADRVGLS